MKHTYNSLFIDGRWVPSHSTEVNTVVSASTEEAIGLTPVGDATDVDAAVTAARRAFDGTGWSGLKPRAEPELLDERPARHERMTMRIKEEAVPEQAAAPAGVEATRERMLRCALELFTERGYDGSSIGMIASGMELSKGAVSYHFPTKEDLLEAVVEPAWSDLDTFLEKVGPGPLRPGRRREAIAEYVSLMVKHRALLAFLAREGDRQRPESGLSRWPSLADRLEQLFYGDAPDLGERIYGAAAFRGLALAPSMFPEVGDDVLQEHLLRFAETTLARPRRPRDNRAEPSQ